MKKKTINKDIYNLSKTLYGAERFKLCIDTIKSAEKKGNFSVNDLPDVYLYFEDKKEYEDFSSIYVDFTLVNNVVEGYLREIFYSCLLLIISAPVVKGPEDRIPLLFDRIGDFFDVLGFVDEINSKYDIDLFTYLNRKTIDEYQKYLEEVDRDFSKIYKEIVGEKILKTIKESMKKRPKTMKKRISDLFDVLHQLITQCLNPV